MLLTIAAFVIALGPLILVHELGHFIVAKIVGIQVLRFSIGFGRPLLRWRRGETEYWISWIPLGGYVKMAGLEDEGPQGTLEGGKSDVPIDPARAYDQKPLGARLAVILAGVTMNLLFAFVIYAGLFMTVGEPRLAITPVDKVDAGKLPPGADALATLQRGDLITRINGHPVRTWDDLEERFLKGPPTTSLEIAGRPDPIVLHFAAKDDASRARVLRELHTLVPARIGLVTPGQPAARAGLGLGDVVIRAGGDTIRSWDEMVRKVRANPGVTLPLDILRGDSIVHVTLVPETETQVDSSGKKVTHGVIGAISDPRGPIIRVPVGPGTALIDGAKQTAFQLTGIVVTLKNLVTGHGSTRDVGGPILIAQMSGQMVRLGFAWFLGFVAALSVSLAVLNLLPIPVLDGGHTMFLIAEAIRRRPLSPQLRLRLTQVGMLLVLAIMVLVISNDVLRNVH